VLQPLVALVPAVQEPLQQLPPLHCLELVPLQLVPHCLDTVSQALSAGQSPGALQPQTPLTQTEPLAPQVAQPSPSFPQAAAFVRPVTHVPALQQPPLQACVGLHAVVHW
jgi:hypothetical protein